jgi:hypothetical protein
MLMCCVCTFSLRRESTDMILEDEPLISKVVLSHLGRIEILWIFLLVLVGFISICFALGLQNSRTSPQNGELKSQDDTQGNVFNSLSQWEHLQESPKNSPLKLILGVTSKNMSYFFSPPPTFPLKVDLLTLLRGSCQYLSSQYYLFY